MLALRSPRSFQVRMDATVPVNSHQYVGWILVVLDDDFPDDSPQDSLLQVDGAMMMSVSASDPTIGFSWE